MRGKPTVGKQVDIQKCIELYASGLSMSAVGREMGHCHGVIHYNLIRNGITIRSQRESQRKPVTSQKIAEMYNTGMSAAEVAKELGITYQCIYDRLAEAGVKTRNRREQIKMMMSRGTDNFPKGDKSKLWKGGESIDTQGYRHINIGGGYALEHRLVWEKANGPLLEGFIIHHLNGNKLDNRLENLCMLPRKHHSPKSITAPYKKRIRELESELEQAKRQFILFREAYEIDKILKKRV